MGCPSKQRMRRAEPEFPTFQPQDRPKPSVEIAGMQEATWIILIIPIPVIASTYAELPFGLGIGKF